MRHTSGLAVGAGLGYTTGGYGGNLSYFAEWGHPRLRFGGTLGLGYFPLDGAHPPRDHLGVSALGFGSFGKRSHRLYFDLGVSTGRLGVAEDAFDRRMWGLSTGAGYEVLTRRGFLMRLSGAPGVWLVRGTLLEPSDRFFGTLQILLGWKLW